MKKYFAIAAVLFVSCASYAVDEATQRLFDTYQPVVLCTPAESSNINSAIHDVSSGRDFKIIGQPVMSSISANSVYNPVVCVVIQRT
jgi:hypothetical protein